LDERLYTDCLKHSNRYNKVDGFWEDLATRNGYKNVEKLRSEFRRERDRRESFAPQKTIGLDSHHVVIFDIETLPLRAYAWKTWKEDIGPAQLIDDWIICSWAAKDLMLGEIRSQCLTPREALKRNDKRIVSGLWKEFDSSSILIGHNINEFDIPKSNTRFLYYGMKPPSPYRTIDTLRILKYNFAFTYNRLNYVNGVLGLTEKVDNEGFPLWAKCSEGNLKALKLMEQYNQGDILSEEELYLAVRAWDNRHPNIGMFYENNASRCKNCGYEDLVILGQPYYTNLGEYQSRRCNNCGAINRVSKNSTSKAKRESLLR